MSIYVAVGGTNGTGGYTLRLYDSAGNLQWSKTTNYDVRGVAFDSAGNLVVAAGYDIKKYALDGTEITSGSWPLSTLDTSYAAATDGADNVVIGRNRSAVPYRPVHKYDSTGSEQWTYDHGADIYAVACDGSGNVICGGLSGSSSMTTRKLTSGGSASWSKNHGGTIFGVACDGSGNVAAVGNRASSITTRVYDSSGTQQWTADHGAGLGACAFDASGNLVTGGNVSSSITTRFYNSSGTQQWTANHGARVRGIAIDPNGMIYAAGDDDGSGITLRAYDNGGTEQWTAQHGATLYCAACYQVQAITTTVPALAVAVALKPPAAQIFAFQIPALAVRVGLAIPTAPSRPALPAIADDDVLSFRLFLTGLPRLVEWPLRDLRIHRYRGARTYIGARCPISRADWDEVTGYPLEAVIYAGVRDRDGAETLGEWIRGTVEAMTLEREPRSIIAALSAYSAAAAEAPAVREPVVFSRTLIDSVRSARCALDFALAPGDTADIGVQITVGAIRYQITPADAWMDVEED